MQVHLGRAKKRIPKLISGATDAKNLTESMDKMASHLADFFDELNDSGIDFYEIEDRNSGKP